MKLEATIAVVLSTSLVSYVTIADLLAFDPLYPTPAAISDTVIYRVTLFCTTYMILQFCTFLGVLRQRYKWLNSHIKIAARNCSRQQQSNYAST